MKNFFTLFIAILVMVSITACNSQTHIADGAWGDVSFYAEKNGDAYGGAYFVFGSIETPVSRIGTPDKHSTEKPKRYWNKAFVLVNRLDTPTGWQFKHHSSWSFNKEELRVNDQLIPLVQITDNVIYFNDDFGNIYEYMPEEHHATFAYLNDYIGIHDNEGKNGVVALWKHLQEVVGDSRKVYEHDGTVVELFSH